MQTTSHILMVRPVRFGFNVQTAESNAFQQANNADAQEVQNKALAEFDNFVDVLRRNGVDVTVVNDTVEPHTPDSIFPNNWISMHDEGTVVTYPMLAENRRLERREDIVETIARRFSVLCRIDLSMYENYGQILEGTGSMILDHQHRIAYACLSPRTDEKLLQIFCERLGYTPCAFTALDRKGGKIYHTNVMMGIGSRFVIIADQTIVNPDERNRVLQTFKDEEKKIISISTEQMEQFAGNVLAVRNKQGQELLVMSERAFKSLTDKQRADIEKYSNIVHAPLYTIEDNGGGSARCMMAEIFLPMRDCCVE